MKYFTPALIKRMNDPDMNVVVSALGDWDDRLAAYEKRLEVLWSKLPRAIKRYLTEFRLHDADFCGALETNGRGRALARLALLFRQGEQLVSLQYDLAGKLLIKKALASQYGSVQPHMRYDEFDLRGGGVWEHRLLLSTGEELTMRFRKFQVVEGSWLLPAEGGRLKAVS